MKLMIFFIDYNQDQTKVQQAWTARQICCPQATSVDQSDLASLSTSFNLATKED